MTSAVALLALLTACGAGGSSGGPSTGAGAAGSGSGAPASANGAAPSTQVLSAKMAVFQLVDISLLPEIAQDAGFFKKNALNISIVPVKNGPAGVAALKSGSVDMVTCEVTALCGPLVAKGESLKLLSGLDTSIFVLVKKGASQSAAVASLKGAKVGVTALGSSQQFVLEGLLKNAGMSKDDITIVPTGSLAANASALKTGLIGAAMENATGLAQLTAEGIPYTVIADLRSSDQSAAKDDLAGINEFGVWAEGGWTQGHADLVKRLQLSLMEAACWANKGSNLSKVAQIVNKATYLGVPAAMPQSDVESFLRSEIPSATVPSYSPSAVKAWSDFGVGSGALTKPVTPDEVLAPGVAASHADVVAAVQKAGMSCS